MQLYINKYDNGDVKSVEFLDVPRIKFRGDWLNEHTDYPNPSIFNLTIILRSDEDADIIEALQNEGITLGTRKDDSDDNLTYYYVNSKLSYSNYEQGRGSEPKVDCVINGKIQSYHKENIPSLHDYEIESCDLVVNPWINAKRDNKITLYCNELTLVLKTSRVKEKYAEYEHIN